MPTAYVTAPVDVADELAELLVEQRLAACVNRTPIRSVYRWDGEIHDDEEVLLLAKTTDDRYGDLVDRIVEEHPHDVPCVERFDETDVLGSFAEWRDGVVG
ncbi:divalent-cation tolerance protein CutA [Halobacteriales archaeon QS_1_68_17]|nr:MAG: divalent-cation tolerance protein CutA [Halobacteriales archaeon QS_1_68_17]